MVGENFDGYRLIVRLRKFPSSGQSVGRCLLSVNAPPQLEARHK